MGPVINNTMLEQLVNLTESVHTLINQSEININDVREHTPYTVPVPMFNYFLCSLITLMVVVLIVVLYSYFFVWVLKVILNSLLMKKIKAKIKFHILGKP